MTQPLRGLIARARASLVTAGLAPGDAAIDAEVLARHVLGWDRAQLVTRAQLLPPAGFVAAFDQAIARRGTREPVALITGQREFWGLDFIVTPDVLIPRPETELIVEQALARCAGRPCLSIADVGTGSGCIAVAIGTELPAARVIAIDRSAAALAIAARNVARHGLTGRVSLIRGNLLDATAGPFHLILSNPPYVARRDAASLPPEVARFEPAGALFGGDDGLEVLRALVDSAGDRLAAGGLLVVEFGAGQEADLCNLSEARGWTVETVADLAGIPRVAVMSRG